MERLLEEAPHPSRAVGDNLADLQYGVSVTDGCIDWDATETCLRKLRETVRDALQERQAG